MRNILKASIIVVLIVTFSVCAITGVMAAYPGNDMPGVVSTECSLSGESARPDISEPDFSARAGAAKEEAEQTILTTDKNAYCFDDKVILTINPLYDNDLLFYGHNFIVQYYDNILNEWKNSKKEVYFTEEGLLALGSATETFKLSDRVEEAAEKYRIIFDVYVNDFPVKLISNEFSIQCN